MARNTARKSPRLNRFSMIPSVNLKRSVFDRSHDYKTTLDSGYLVPFYVDEVLPGDSFKLNVATFARMNTPIVPFMDNVYLETFFFFVPTRLVWDNWQKFNGEQKNPGDSTDFLVPSLSNSGRAFNFQNGSIFDYFGLPTNVAIPTAPVPGVVSDNLVMINSLPFRAYNLIYNEWFRDENLQNSVNVPTGDGPDLISNFNLLKRGKRHDYFTSALPWPQKGPAVDVGLSGNAPVVGFGANDVWSFANSVDQSAWTMSANESDGIMYSPKQSSEHGVSLSALPSARFDNRLGFPDGNVDDTFHPLMSLSGDQFAFNGFLNRADGVQPYADLSGVNAITINDLRQAFQIQKLLERDARGGTRYTEILRSHFGVISPDARLQRPEYLGGSRSRINIVPVQQTSNTNDVSPQGNLAAYGLASDVRKGFNKSFVEHGYIIGLVNIRADLTYQQGLNRMWSRRSRFDFYWPSLAHLGEQAILNKEIYVSGTVTDNQVFGYQERYAEYRYYPSMITGKLRSTDPQSLDVWHLAQKFDSLPTLSSQFIEENPPIKRALAVQNEPEFFLDVWFDCKCARPMPVYGVPGLVDHF
nr:major capsid protein [Rattus norvegicus microvirus]